MLLSKNLASNTLVHNVTNACQAIFCQTIFFLSPPPLAILVLQRASSWPGVAEALPLPIKQAGRCAPGECQYEVTCTCLVPFHIFAPQSVPKHTLWGNVVEPGDPVL